MKRTEELTEVSKSVNSGTIINSNFGEIRRNGTSVERMAV
jgi:transcription termination factor Rho